MSVLDADIEAVVVSAEQIQAKITELAGADRRRLRRPRTAAGRRAQGRGDVHVRPGPGAAAARRRWSSWPCSSYGTSTTCSGVVRILKDLDRDITGRDVLIVEDIIDSGLTLSWLLKNLRRRNPASIEVVALLRKPDAVKVHVRCATSASTSRTSSWSATGWTTPSGTGTCPTSAGSSLGLRWLRAALRRVSRHGGAGPCARSGTGVAVCDGAPRRQVNSGRLRARSSSIDDHESQAHSCGRWWLVGRPSDAVVRRFFVLPQPAVRRQRLPGGQHLRGARPDQRRQRQDGDASTTRNRPLELDLKTPFDGKYQDQRVLPGRRQPTTIFNDLLDGQEPTRRLQHQGQQGERAG